MKTETSRKLESENQKLAEMRERLDVCETDLECARLSPPAATQRALQILDGKTTGEEEIFDRDKLTCEHATLAKAVEIQERRVAEARQKNGREIYESRLAEHDSLVEQVCDAVENLRDAMQAERDFVAEIQRTGVSPKLLRFEDLPWLKKLFAIPRETFRQSQRSRGFDV